MLPNFLSSSFPLESHIFVVSKISLRIIGFYPETPRSIWLQLFAGFNLILLVCSCIGELLYGIYYLPIDFLEALDALCPLGTSTLAAIKMFFIWMYRSEFAELIHRIRELSAAEVTPKKLEIKRKHFTLATRLTAAVLISSSCTSLAYLAQPLILSSLQYINGQGFAYAVPFKMMLPTKMLRMPIYPITYALEAWYCVLTGVAISGADSFFLGFCLYFTALLQCLTEDLKLVLLQEAENDHDDDECCAKLSRIIDRHNEIFSMTQKFSKIIVAITLGHFVTSSIISCMSIIDLLLNTGFAIVIYIVYTFTVFTELFLYCYGGSEIIESSEAIGTVAYSSQWYMRDIKIQKMVLRIIERSQRPIVIQVPFFSPSMPVLAAILRFSGSLITLVKTFV